MIQKAYVLGPFQPCADESPEQKAERLKQTEEDNRFLASLSPSKREAELKRREEDKKDKKIAPLAKGNIRQHFLRKKVPENHRSKERQ